MKFGDTYEKQAEWINSLRKGNKWINGFIFLSIYCLQGLRTFDRHFDINQTGLSSSTEKWNTKLISKLRENRVISSLLKNIPKECLKSVICSKWPLCKNFVQVFSSLLNSSRIINFFVVLVYRSSMIFFCYFSQLNWKSSRFRIHFILLPIISFWIKIPFFM